MIRHEFHPEALAEYEDAAQRYAELRPELGPRFVAAVDAAIARICDAPERWRIFDGGEIRRVLTREFPYGILYGIEPDHLLIVAVAHCGREPDYWKRRLAPGN